MPALEARNDPGIPAALRQANKRVHATYFLPYLSHAIMEPMNATAHVREDQCEVWSLLADEGVKSANFTDYHTLRMSQAPNIEVYLLDSDAKIGGLGEPSLPLVAPSVTNALFATTGARIRRLPLTPERVLEALSRV